MQSVTDTGCRMGNQVRPRFELGHSVIRVTFRRSIRHRQGILNHQLQRLPSV